MLMRSVAIALILTITAVNASLREEQERIALAVAEASVHLETAGISGLCHPSSDAFAPYFPLCSSDHRALYNEGEYEPSFQEDEWLYIRNGGLALLCVCVSALASGLTMGLMTLNPEMLTVIMNSPQSTALEKHRAEKVLVIVKQHHLLLVTLLLLNSMASESLPLFLDQILPTHIAILVAVFGVLFFGEIIPSAIFTGPYKMFIAAKMVPMLRVFMFVLWPVAFPVAKILDLTVQEEQGPNLYTPPTYEMKSSAVDWAWGEVKAP